jgi:hypothetical protein
MHATATIASGTKSERDLDVTEVGTPVIGTSLKSMMTMITAEANVREEKDRKKKRSLLFQALLQHQQVEEKLLQLRTKHASAQSHLWLQFYQLPQ